jgi:hypothetical protein
MCSLSPRPNDEMDLNRECKKRKRVSEAEKVATELSKLVCELYKLVPRHTQECHVKFENNRIFFPQSKQINLDAEACNLTDHRQRPCYCSRSEFKFEASLPDREHLTRFSVSISVLTRVAERPNRRPSESAVHPSELSFFRFLAPLADHSATQSSTSIARTVMRCSPVQLLSRVARSQTTSSRSGMK